MKSVYEEWLERAEEDLKCARLMLREGIHSQVCYFSQQAIEKCLKGSLVAQKKMYPRSHSLTALAGMLPGFDLDTWYKKLEKIEEYYVPTRYPDAAPGMKASGPPNQKEAEEALSVAGEIFNLVSQTIHSTKPV